MSPNFKSYSKLQHYILTLGFLVLGLQVSAQQLVYDLKQEWVFFNIENHGFLPIGEQNIENRVISFSLANSEFDQFYLSVAVVEKSYLFYGTKLIATLPAGTTNLRVDSLKLSLGNNHPFITIYSKKLLPELITEIRTLPIEEDKITPYQPIRYSNNFSNFFYLSATILFLIFVFIKSQFSELADQYLLFHRTFRIKTIDELIYKIQYLRFPNLFFIAFISLMFGFAILSFMYFYPGELSLLNISSGANSFWNLVLGWLEISGLVLLIIALKYFLTLLMSSVFSLNIANIHYGSSLRLLLALSFILAILTFLQYFIIGLINQPFYWFTILLGVLIMEGVLFFKLSLVTTHTLLYIIVYLCATEIIPIVILFKLYTT